MKVMRGDMTAEQTDRRSHGKSPNSCLTSRGEGTWWLNTPNKDITMGARTNSIHISGEEDFPTNLQTASKQVSATFLDTPKDTNSSPFKLGATSDPQTQSPSILHMNDNSEGKHLQANPYECTQVSEDTQHPTIHHLPTGH